MPENACVLPFLYVRAPDNAITLWWKARTRVDPTLVLEKPAEPHLGGLRSPEGNDEQKRLKGFWGSPQGSRPQATRTEAGCVTAEQPPRMILKS